MTPAQLKDLLDDLAGRELGARGAALAEALVAHLPEREITGPARLAHFLAQTAHETAAFTYLHEEGGPEYFARYDGRADLGNTQPGDGYRYRGRGLIQLTGRANYAKAGDELGLDLDGDPELAASPDVAVQTAALYWRDHGLNALADADDIAAITRRINGGYNGLASRKAYLQRARALIGDLLAADPAAAQFAAPARPAPAPAPAAPAVRAAPAPVAPAPPVQAPSDASAAPAPVQGGWLREAAGIAQRHGLTAIGGASAAAAFLGRHEAITLVALAAIGVSALVAGVAWSALDKRQRAAALAGALSAAKSAGAQIIPAAIAALASENPNNA